MTNEPATVSVNDALDLAIDSAQGLKTFVRKLAEKGIDTGQEGVVALDEAVDSLIDRLQKLKG